MAASPRLNDGVDGARMHASRGMPDSRTASPGTPRRSSTTAPSRSAPPALSSSAWSAAHVDEFLQPLHPMQSSCQGQLEWISWPTPASCMRIKFALVCSRRAWFVAIGAEDCRCDGRQISLVARRRLEHAHVRLKCDLVVDRQITNGDPLVVREVAFAFRTVLEGSQERNI
jgi:hypothetical protein